MAKDIEFEGWLIVLSTFSTVRLMHKHPDQGYPYRDFCYMNEAGDWYCEWCHKQVPDDFAFLAELAGARGINHRG